MAYLRKEEETVDVDYPFDKVWEETAKAMASLEWKTEESNKSTYTIKAKTKSNFMAYSSEITIKVIAQNEKTTRVTVSAETPVTTITGIIDFGRTQERINSFFLALAKQLKPEQTAQKKPV